MKKKLQSLSEKIPYLEPDDRQIRMLLSDLYCRIKKIKDKCPSDQDKLEWILNSDSFSEDDKNLIVFNPKVMEYLLKQQEK